MAAKIFSKDEYISRLKLLGYQPSSNEDAYGRAWKNKNGHTIHVKNSNEDIPYWILERQLHGTPHACNFSGEIVRREHEDLN